MDALEARTIFGKDLRGQLKLIGKADLAAMFPMSRRSK
jgi:hypothetical protein